MSYFHLLFINENHSVWNFCLVARKSRTKLTKLNKFLFSSSSLYGFGGFTSILSLIFYEYITTTITSTSDPLEKEMTTHSSILAWEISWTEELGRLQLMGWTRDLKPDSLSFFVSSFSEVPWGMWDISSLTRNWTHTLYSGSTKF